MSIQSDSCLECRSDGLAGGLTRCVDAAKSTLGSDLEKMRWAVVTAESSGEAGVC